MLKRLGILSLLFIFALSLAAYASRFNRVIYPVVMKDDSGFEFRMKKKPKRIISTMPGITEMLFSINLKDRIVGVTEFCNYPEEAKEIEKIGRMRMNLEKIISLEADLIIMDGDAQKKDIEKFRKHDLPVFVINPNSIKSLFATYEKLGILTANYHAMYTTTEWMKRKIKWKEVQARKFYTRETMKPSMEVTIDGDTVVTKETMVKVVKLLKQTDAMVLISKRPVVVASEGTFIDDLLKTIGVKNVVKSKEKYPKIGKEQIFKLDPDVIITTSDIADKPEHIYNDGKFKHTTAGITKKVLIIDADIISRPGPRLVTALEKLYNFIYDQGNDEVKDEES